MIHSFKQNESGLSFLRNRIARIYPAYIILSMPLIIVFTLKTNSIIYFLHNITLVSYFEWTPITTESDYVRRVNASPVAWTLFYEMYFYFLFSLTKILFKTKKSVAIATSAIITANLLFFLSIRGGNGALGWENLSYPNIFTSLSLASFVAGMLIHFVPITNTRKEQNIFIFLIPFLSWLCLKLSEKYLTHSLINDQVRDLVFSSIPSWFFVAVLINSNDIGGLLAKIIYKIGAISFSLYLIHANFYIIRGWLHINDYSLIIQISYFIITFSLSLILADLSYRKIEKFRFKREKFAPGV